jgi:uncharacterized protein
MADDLGFLGRGWSFPPTFKAHTKRAAMEVGEEDIRQSLTILLSTTPGERVMQPEYGCYIRHIVFETMDHSRVTELHDMITRAILLFEPRVIVEDVSVDVVDWLDGLVRITLVYRIIATNTRHNLVLPFYLYEATSVGLSA